MSKPQNNTVSDFLLIHGKFIYSDFKSKKKKKKSLEGLQIEFHNSSLFVIIGDIHGSISKLI